MSKKSQDVARRTFLKTSGSAVAVGTMAPQVIPSGVLALRDVPELMIV